MAMYDQPENITTPGLRKYYAFERSVFNVTDKVIVYVLACVVP